MASALYLDTSAVLRSVLEVGTTPTIEEKIEVAATKPLRTLDALHLATYLLPRRRIGGLELLIMICTIMQKY